jgi:cytochrome c
MRRTRMVCALVIASCALPASASAQAGNQSPTVTAGRTPTGNVRVGVPISFTATATDPDGDAVTYAWDFGDGTTSTEQNPTKAFLAAATRTVTVTVSDGKGGTGSATLSVVVQANRNPSANGLTVTPQAGFAPLQVSFGGAATDPDGPSHTLSYSWDFNGDGTEDSTVANPTTTFTAAGTYTPTVRVSDPFGGLATRSFVINVLPDAEQAGSRFRILIYSRTAGFRHSAIDEGITAIKLLGAQNNFHVDAAEEPALFTDAVLAKYDAVVFLSTTGDTLPTDAQQAAFERYIQAGGGYVGVHSAADTEYLWPWYGRLVGGYFRNHPNGLPGMQGGRPANVIVEDAAHHSTRHLTSPWNRVDEWYNYQGIVNPVVNGGGTDYSPRNSGVHVLLTLDESSYDEADGSDGVNDDHPISWCHKFDGGRAWYTGMGHTENTYLEPAFLQHLLGGLEVAAGVVTDKECGVTSRSVPSDVSGTVPGTLSLTVSPSANLGVFTPGLAREYTATLAANVISTGGDATLSVADPSSTATGHLVNGTFSLPQPLLVAGAPLPATVKTWSAPVSNDPVSIEVRQAIGATDPLRTGTYSKTLVFTLSTTSP